MAECSTSNYGNRVFLWCVPRSCSTALIKCLSGVDGMEVWFEPYCFCFLAKVKSRNYLSLNLPDDVYEGHEDVFQRAAGILEKYSPCTFKPEHLSYSSVKGKLEGASSPHVLVKDMAFALSKDQFHLIPSGYKHSFLIRNPLRVFHSNRRDMITYLFQRNLLDIDPDQYDLARDDPLITPGLLFKDVYDIWRYVRENIEPNPIVLDGDDLLSNPAEVLPKYCRAMAIPYDEALLQWDASREVTKTWNSPMGHKDDLQTNCSSFYKVSMNSGCFFQPKPMPSPDHLTPDVIRCSDQVMTYYREMYGTRLH